MPFTGVGKGLGLTGCVVVALALLVFSVAACTSDSTVQTTAASSTTSSTTTTVGASEAQSALLHTVTVSGTGHMSARPDEAVINIGVQSSGSTAAEALDANSQQMQKVLSRLKAEGIPDSAIETSDVSVYGYPIHDPKTGQQTGTSYQASNSAKVTLTDFSAIGSVFAAAAEAGANNLSGPIWQLSDNTKAQSEALAQASAQARAKAEAFAAANGVTLGEVLVLTEGYSSPVYYYGARAESATTTAGGAVYAPPINPQNLDIYINATVTYQLNR